MQAPGQLVAGARYEALQMDLEPPNRFIVGSGDVKTAA
jgi:hypothetical protein